MYYTKLTGLDVVCVIHELSVNGELSATPEATAAEVLTQHKLRHLNIGAVDIKKSPTLQTWLQRLSKLNPRCVAFINKLDTTPTVWHRDGPYAQCAVNIPWFGAEDTFTEWTDDDGLTEKVICHPNQRVDRVEGIGNKDATESACLHGEVWALDIHAYHRVRSLRSSGYRGLLSIRFGAPGLTYAQLCSRLNGA